MLKVKLTIFSKKGCPPSSPRLCMELRIACVPSIRKDDTVTVQVGVQNVELIAIMVMYLKRVQLN